MHHDHPTSRVLAILAQLVSPAGRPGARMLPRELMQEAFARFIEYAERLRGDEHIDADRHLRALPFVRELAPILECWPLDAVPREVTLQARRAWDAWWPEKADPAFWDQTDRDAERWAETKDGADEGVDREALDRSFREAAILGRVCANAANDMAAEQDDAALRLAIAEEANRNAERRSPCMVAADLAGTMAAGLNLAGVLASPRVLARASTMPARDEVLDLLDAFIRTASGPGQWRSSEPLDLGAAKQAGERLRAACAEWTPCAVAPVAVQQAARALLSAFGIPEPPEGWNAWNGEMPVS